MMRIEIKPTTADQAAPRVEVPCGTLPVWAFDEHGPTFGATPQVISLGMGKPATPALVVGSRAPYSFEAALPVQRHPARSARVATGPDGKDVFLPLLWAAVVRTHNGGARLVEQPEPNHKWHLHALVVLRPAAGSRGHVAYTCDLLAHGGGSRPNEWDDDPLLLLADGTELRGHRGVNGKAVHRVVVLESGRVLRVHRSGAVGGGPLFQFLMFDGQRLTARTWAERVEGANQPLDAWPVPLCGFPVRRHAAERSDDSGRTVYR